MTKHSAPHTFRFQISRRLLAAAMAIIAGAPVFSGASLYAQSDTVIDFTSLIRTVNENTESVTIPADSVNKKGAQSAKKPGGKDRKVIYGKEGNRKAATADSTAHVNGRSRGRHDYYNRNRAEDEDLSTADNVLDRIIMESRNKKNQERKLLSSASVLEFMTKVYSDHNFYQSGHWDDAEDWSAITRNIRLPDYDPSDFFRPVWGIITSSYGFRPTFGRMHKGIDLSLNIGDTVRAALPGVVAKVSYDPGGYGHYVVMVHNNGLETRYAHLQAPLSTLGQTLHAGEALGIGGNSGNSTGPHLHFEVRYRGTALDPASIFNFHGARRPEER